jgi:hypothetical protein
MAVLPSLRAAPAAAGAQAPAPPPTFNAGNTANTNISETNHDITFSLGAGTNRVVVVSGFFQHGSITWSSATFYNGTTSSASAGMTAVPASPVTNTTATRISLAAFCYAIPDAVAPGTKTVRMVTSGNVAVAQFVDCYNNVGATPSDTEPLTVSGAQPTPVNVTAGAGDLVISFLGMDVNQSSGSWAPTSGVIATRHLMGTSNAGDIMFASADGVVSAGTVNGGWTRGAGTPGGVLDMCAVVVVLPRL